MPSNVSPEQPLDTVEGFVAALIVDEHAPLSEHCVLAGEVPSPYDLNSIANITIPVSSGIYD